MDLKKILIIILLLWTTPYTFEEVQSRFAGVVEDIKYLGPHKGKYIFIVYTNNDRIYKIASLHIPNFTLNDSIIEYWINYQLKGLGKRSSIYYYPVLK